jgi:hypothetical protein
MMLLLFMSMRWNYISQMQPPTGLLLYTQESQMTYEHGEPRWNNTEKANGRTRRETCPSVICPPQIPHGLNRVRTRDSAVKENHCEPRHGHIMNNVNFKITYLSVERLWMISQWFAKLYRRRATTRGLIFYSSHFIILTKKWEWK